LEPEEGIAALGKELHVYLVSVGKEKKHEGEEILARLFYYKVLF